MKGLKWVALIVALLAGVIIALPAGVWSIPVERASQGQWLLSAAEGTVWNGKGQWMAVDSKGDTLPMSRMSWEFQPGRLLKGRLAWTILSEGQHGSVAFGLGGWTVERLHFSLPMAALSRLSPEWKGANLAGQLRLSVDRFASEAGNLVGNLRVEWLSASSSLTRIAPFGSYVLEASGNGKGLVLHVGTLDGDLMVEGSGQWQMAGSFALGGVAEAHQERYEQLKPLMLMLGQPNGATGIQWQLKPGH